MASIERTTSTCDKDRSMGSHQCYCLHCMQEKELMKRHIKAFLCVFFLVVGSVLVAGGVFAIGRQVDELFDQLEATKHFVPVGERKTKEIQLNLFWDNQKYAVEAIKWADIVNTTQKKEFLIDACVKTEFGYPALVGSIISGNFERKIAPIRPCSAPGKYKQSVFAISNQDSIHISLGGPHVPQQNFVIEVGRLRVAPKSSYEYDVFTHSYGDLPWYYFGRYCILVALVIMMVFSVYVILEEIRTKVKPIPQKIK